ncbi:hypothetical protein LINPERPRIM_LOCUS38000 [Linum perenne]
MFTGVNDPPPFAESNSPPPSNHSGDLFSPPDQNGEDFESVVAVPILPPHEEDGFSLRECRRENAMSLEKKEKMKKILKEAGEYKECY